MLWNMQSSNIFMVSSDKYPNKLQGIPWKLRTNKKLPCKYSSCVGAASPRAAEGPGQGAAVLHRLVAPGASTAGAIETNRHRYRETERVLTLSISETRVTSWECTSPFTATAGERESEIKWKRERER